MLPSLDRLKVFYFVYTRLSVTAAASDLHVTQSAVSQALAKLEDELGAPLFTRLHKKMVPTNSAHRLHEIVRPFMEELEQGLDRFRREREWPSGPLRIGAPPEFGQEYLPGLFASFRGKYPDVTFYLQHDEPGALLAALTAGDIDFAFIDMLGFVGPQYCDINRFSFESIVEEEIVLACSGRYYDDRLQGDCSWANLLKMEYIAYENYALVLKGWFRHHFESAPSRLNEVLVVDAQRAVLAGIRGSLGLGIIAPHMAWKDIGRGDVRVVTTGRPEAINIISLVQLLDKIPGLAEKTFQAHFRQAMRSAAHKEKFRVLTND